MNNKTYDILKWIAQYLLPASGTLYFALSSIWGLPYGEQVVGTIAALTAFLGVLLGLSTSEYNKKDRSDGTLEIDTSNKDRDIYRLNLTTGLEDIKNRNSIELKINPNKYFTDAESQDKHGL